MKPKLITLPDGRQVEDRRQPRRFRDVIVKEPLAAIAFGSMIAVIAAGVIFSSFRDAKASSDAREQAEVAANNAQAAKVNAQAAKDLAGTIDQAVDLLTRVGAQSRKSTFDSHQAMQDTLVCILSIPPDDRTSASISACTRPLTPPPNPDGTAGTTTTTGG